MQDRTKLLLLIAISLLFAALFIGVGLNADNYQYFYRVACRKCWLWSLLALRLRSRRWRFKPSPITVF